MEQQRVIFQDLGQMNYKSAWDYQERLLQENVRRKAAVWNSPAIIQSEIFEPAGTNGAIQTSNLARDNFSETFPQSHPATQHYLLFVEHPPVFTLGKSGNISNVLLSEERLAQKGIEFFKTNRGGDITFHGPDQIVGYPILDLEKFDTDIGHYLRNLEEVIIRTLTDYGVVAGRSKGETGVWIDAGIKGRERKICAIGVRCSRWITMHGFAFNVNTDLTYFNYIIPCGIQDKQVTSLQKELNRKIEMEEARAIVKKNFEKVFDVRLVN